MRIVKGQHLHINHLRKGSFDAVALRDFDTTDVEFYPIAVASAPLIPVTLMRSLELIVGVSIRQYWAPGEEIPCRKSLCTLEVID